MPFTVEEATAKDADAIANIFTSDEVSRVNRLQLGTVEPSVFTNGMIERIKEGIQKDDQVYIIARDEETNEVVSYAQWVLPKDMAAKSAEEKADELDEFRNKLMPGMNEPFMMEWKTGIDDLRERVAGGRRHYLLGNIGTLPSYQRRGAASALTRWPFEEADKCGIPVYLDTNEAGHARVMYEKAGFVRKDAVVFDLAKHGGEGTHTHMGMIREPRSQS